MITASMTTVVGRLLGPVLAAGFTAGSFDLLAAAVIYETKPYGVMKAISSGWFGKAPKGLHEALIGCASHYFILTVAAAIYAAAAFRLPILARRPWLMGMLFGAGIFCFMHFVVLPLTPVGFHMKPSPQLALDFAANVMMSGVPIALIVATGLRSLGVGQGR